MNNRPITTHPLNEGEKLLRRKFYESIAAQSDRVDRLSEKLLALELGIPGLFATALEMTHGDKAVLAVDAALYIAFGCWFLALILTMVALTPKKWTVDTTILKQDPSKFSEGLGIEDFFVRSAVYKRRLIFASGILFFCGIFCAILKLR